MKPFFTQPLGQQRQIFFIGLIHQQVNGVVCSNACCIGTADGAPHPVVDFGPVFERSRHLQQQMMGHFVFLQGAGCSQLLCKHSRTQQAGAGQIPVFSHNALVLKGPHQCCFHQSAEDAEQILVIQGHLLFAGSMQPDQYHKAAVLPHACGIHRTSGEEAAIHPQPFLFDGTEHIQPLIHLQRVCRLRRHSGTGGGKAGKPLVLFHTVDGKAVVFQHVFHDLHRLAADLLRLQHKYGDHVHVLDWALHLDESTPHIHERHVFDCENKYGEVAPQQEKALEALGFDLPDPDKPLSRRNNRKITFDAACRKMLFEIAERHGLELEEEAEYGNRKYLEKQDFILAKQKERLAAQQNRLDELTLKVSDMETLLENVSATAYDKAVEVVTDVVRTETRKEDMRMIEDTKKWVLSPERKAPQSTREYAAHRLDTVLDKFLKTMQTTAAHLQEKLLKSEARQKGKEQVKERARDSVLQLLNRLQAEQAQNKPAAQPRTQEGHSEI